MKLHNTLNRQQDTVAFTTITPGTVRMYSCGPTVYDNIHIGNLRAFVVADVLRRTLQAQGLSVEHVMNFTDVDDKTIRRSSELFPDTDPLIALQNLTRKYEDIFIGDMEAIGNQVDAIEFVRATESIDEMQSLITQLHKGGIAYITDDGVYFSIKAYRAAGKQYGQLLKLNTNNTSESRIDNDEYDKESVHDFALWKKQKGSEPSWKFELDDKDLTGRPGWHIECSAMSNKLLGRPFDIHTGGIDLIFPHHENEIAQSTALDDTGYAKYFVHNEHLLVDGKKMSKSLNNFYTLRDVQEKGYDPMAFRLLILQSHYRKQMNFSWEALDAAQNRLLRWYEAVELRWQEDAAIDSGESGEKHTNEFCSKLADDLNSPEALAVIDHFMNQISNGHYCKPCVENFANDVDGALGFNLLDATPNISSDVRGVLSARQAARDAQDWARSDQLRDNLKAQGIAVRDTEHGQIWSRIR